MSDVDGKDTGCETNEASAKKKPVAKRKQARPRKGEEAQVPWNIVDKLLVLGETIKDEKTGRVEVHYPSFSQIAQRFGVSKAWIGQYSKKHKCIARREEMQKREQIKFEQKFIEKRATARALSTHDELRIIDDYLREFDKARREGRVRFDNPNDFNTMIRLKEFKLGNADSRQQIQNMVSLEEIQERHKRLREQLKELSPEVSGLVIKGDTKPKEEKNKQENGDNGKTVN